MRVSALFFLAFSLTQLAAAQEMRRAYTPEDCTAYLSNLPIAADGLYDWRDLVEVEHCDRIKRLQRLTEEAYGAEIEFFDGSIAANRLPSDVRVRIPILRVVFPDRVFFDTDSAALRDEAWQVARIIAQNLRKEPPDVAVFVVGHADIRGPSDYNENLSIDRANALAEAILGYGVNVASVWRLGFGEDMPLVAGSSDYAHGRNRRIEFLFAARPEALVEALEGVMMKDLCQGQSAEEVAQCKRKVAPKNEYTIVETTMGRRKVTASSDSTSVDLSDQEVTVSTRQSERAVETKVERIVVNPRPPRKFKVNPRNNLLRPRGE